jgi:hypothetical protein
VLPLNGNMLGNPTNPQLFNVDAYLFDVGLKNPNQSTWGSTVGHGFDSSINESAMAEPSWNSTPMGMIKCHSFEV